MNMIFDIILVLLYLVVVLICTKRGFVKSIWSAVTIIGSILLTRFYGPVLALWIKEKFIYNRVFRYVYDSVEAIKVEKNGGVSLSDFSENLPDDLLRLIRFSEVDTEAIQDNFSSFAAMSEDEILHLADSIASPVSGTISNIVACICVFVCSLVAISLIGLILKLIVKMPVIKSLNSILGAFLGLIEGFIIIWIICALGGSLLEHGIVCEGSYETLFNLMEHSRIIEFFCEFSLLELIGLCF